ncbi:MAG: hypothetical protein AUK55_14340 [Syntrophobacteraceae bacterium CG2_30_61_12]|nr:MAG: hypothetical protein AUK55_14340 [Syntrophobacteraceae bacterium CG2_30_61_12]
MPRRVCELVFSYYPGDARVRRAAESLSQGGYHVEVLCLRDKGESKSERVRGVQVRRLDLRHRRLGPARLIGEYLAFMVWGLLQISVRHLGHPYDLIHVHNMPEMLVFCAVLPKLTGTRVILDLHDPMPEIFLAEFQVSENHPMIKLLRLIERISTAFADVVITTNIAFRDLFISRGVKKEKIHMVMNSPQETIFEQTRVVENQVGASSSPKWRMIYHGTILRRQGLDTAIMAVDRLRRKIPGLELRVYGAGEFLPEVKKMVLAAGLQGIVTFHGVVTLEEIAEALTKTDLVLVPNKLNAFTNINLPTRIFEALSMHKPVIAPRTRGIRDYFDEESIFFFEAGNPADLAKVMFEVYSNTEGRERKVNKGMRIYEKFKWSGEASRLLALVNGIQAR